MTQSPRTTLLRAAAAIKECGWVQGRGGSLLEGFCVIGAIDLAADALGTSDDEAENALKAHLKIPSLVVWNDAPTRTKEEVLAALEAAAQSEQP